MWTDGSTAQAGRLDDLGVGWARVVAVWSAIEPSDNAFNFSDLDAQVNAASGNTNVTATAKTTATLDTFSAGTVSLLLQGAPTSAGAANPTSSAGVELI